MATEHLGMPDSRQAGPQRYNSTSGIELAGIGMPTSPSNMIRDAYSTSRENLENLYTGNALMGVAESMAAHRSFSGPRGLSTHAVSNSLSMR